MNSLDVFRNADYSAAREAAASLNSEQTRLAAVQAGFAEWIRGADYYPFSRIEEGVEDALAMPIPSPFMERWRAAAGFVLGTTTTGRSRWTLGVAEDLTDTAGQYDTGVRLVICQRPAGSREHTLRLPLDITLPTSTLQRIQSRPDRVSVRIGERQIPDEVSFRTADAQRLLLVAHNFLRILGSGEATTLTPPPRRSPILLGRK